MITGATRGCILRLYPLRHRFVSTFPPSFGRVYLTITFEVGWGRWQACNAWITIPDGVSPEGEGLPLSEPCPAHGLAQTLRHQPGPSRTHPQSVTPIRFSTESFLQIILVVYGALIFASLPLSPGKTGPSPSPALPPLCLRISPRQPIVLQCHSDAECGSPHTPGLASLT